MEPRPAAEPPAGALNTSGPARRSGYEHVECLEPRELAGGQVGAVDLVQGRLEALGRETVGLGLGFPDGDDGEAVPGLASVSGEEALGGPSPRYRPTFS
jgi:hypothetical protein